MRLLVISDTAHHLRGDEIVGWGATVREIDHLARLFSEVRHLACLHPDEAPENDLPYRSPKVRLVPLPPSGGPRLADKLGILSRSPSYLAAMRRELRHADVVHVRCPANVALLAVLLLAAVRRPRPRWIKYAGNWRPATIGPWSYAFQRWWLRRGWHRGTITVNGCWDRQPPFVRAFENPCLSHRELAGARDAVRDKRLSQPLRLIYVGRLEEAKGVGTILRVLAGIQRAGREATLDLVGDGPGRAGYEGLAEELGVRRLATFHGWLPRPELGPLYARAHLLVLPSESEGWPKVVSEAMGYGVVPLVSAVSCLPQGLAEHGTGRALDRRDACGFTAAACGYAADPEGWLTESRAGTVAAERFTYEHYLASVRTLLRDDLGLVVPEDANPCDGLD